MLHEGLLETALCDKRVLDTTGQRVYGGASDFDVKGGEGFGKLGQQARTVLRFNGEHRVSMRAILLDGDAMPGVRRGGIQTWVRGVELDVDATSDLIEPESIVDDLVARRFIGYPEDDAVVERNAKFADGLQFALGAVEDEAESVGLGGGTAVHADGEQLENGDHVEHETVTIIGEDDGQRLMRRHGVVEEDLCVVLPYGEDGGGAEQKGERTPFRGFFEPSSEEDERAMERVV